jgi:hypothetical protein
MCLDFIVSYPDQARSPFLKTDVRPCSYEEGGWWFYKREIKSIFFL